MNIKRELRNATKIKFLGEHPNPLYADYEITLGEHSKHHYSLTKDQAYEIQKQITKRKVKKSESTEILPKS